jgi:hypothetical protein
MLQVLSWLRLAVPHTLGQKILLVLVLVAIAGFAAFPILAQEWHQTIRDSGTLPPRRATIIPETLKDEV